MTAKLTATAPSSHSSSAGWLRPNSAASSSVGTPPAQPSTAGSGPMSTPLPSQPRSEVSVASASAPVSGPHQPVAVLKRGASPVKAWGSAASSPSIAQTQVTNDFPTAAEAANGEYIWSCLLAFSFLAGTQSCRAWLGRKPRMMLAQTTQQDARDTAASQKLQQSATADAFRGVHLDPNAHHWDEVRPIFLGCLYSP